LPNTLIQAIFWYTTEDFVIRQYFNFIDDLQKTRNDNMRKNKVKVNKLELRNAFSGLGSVQKSDLRNFFVHHSQLATEQAFRRFLYELEKQQIIIPLGAGIYALLDKGSQSATKKKRFSPTWSQELGHLSETIRKAFPYIQYLVWETKVLYEFMIHQPGQNFFILETEKDVAESAFNLLSQEYQGKTFLEPARVTMERYVLAQPDSILISRLVTQSPWKTIHGIPFPKLEKILVDIFVDGDKYYYFQGEELRRIFENAFSTYWINEKTLSRYAGRRMVSEKLLQFVREHTQIELSYFSEDAE
jgi:hypothetical protein